MAENKQLNRSETSGAKVALYSHKNDPVLLEPSGVSFNKRTKGIFDAVPTLISVTTNNALGSPGSWSIECKPANSDQKTLLDKICDDDWVDIAFTRHAREYHVMRGLVTSVRRRRTVNGTGATSYVYTISGMDFTKCWTKTSMWFDATTSESIGDEAMFRINSGGFFSGKSPEEMVKTILFNAFKDQAKFGRANFQPPASMPGASATLGFLDLVASAMDAFTNTPSRKAVNANNLAQPTGAALWALAQQWCDPMFCELFTDTYLSGKPPDIEDGVGKENPISDAAKGPVMALVFRDKPFPTVASQFGSGNLPGYKPGLNGAWFSLPTYIVPRGQIGNDDVGRSGEERSNSFIVQPNLVQEGYGLHFDLMRPLWSPGDINRHGMRRLDISTAYLSDSTQNLTATNEQRFLMRDWYAINPYLLSGTIPLVIGRPDMRIGCRLKIPDVSGKKLDETYYIESISNSWTFGPGLRTVAGVTRGFIGTDSELIKAINDVVADYTPADPAVAGADDSPK